MLKFFRKYQKIFFMFIAVIIIVTFSFFGTQGVTDRIAHHVKDKEVTKSFSGEPIKLSQVDNMSYFLSVDAIDGSNISGHVRPNLFNDGVIRNDFLRTGIGNIFVDKYFDKIKESFKSKFEKIQKYKPFVHFNDPSISLSGIYQMIDPQILTLLGQVQAHKELTKEFFKSYIELYCEQSKVQQDLLRQILIYQEKQNKIEPDSRLYQDNISLFGFETATDWFGKDFVDLVSQFVINTAQVAKEKGYKVTLDESVSDLYSNLKRSLNDKAKGPIADYYKNMLAILRMDEKKVALIWRDVLLFRKYFNDVSNNTLVDNLAYKEFANYSKTKAAIKLYKLPDSLQLKNSMDLIRFEMYLLATTNKASALDVPSKFKSIQEIEKNYPQLIEQKFLVDVKETTFDKASLRVKVKDTYKWQLEDKNWAKLKNKFSFVVACKTSKEKLNFLDNLIDEEKSKLDDFSRKEILKERPDLIDEALISESVKEYDFCFSKDNSLPIKVNDTQKLLELLQKQDKIEKYSDDNINFYSIQVFQRPSEKTLVTFEKAVKDKIIDKVLDNYLEKQYEKIKDKYSQKFEDEEGDFKEFSTVKLEVGQIVFEDIFNRIKSLNIVKDKSFDALAQNRLYTYVENFMQNINTNQNFADSLNPQFKILSEEIEVSRSKNARWTEKAAFSMNEKKYSTINNTNGAIEFFFLDSFKTAQIGPEKIDLAKNAISQETSAMLANKLVKTYLEKNCIVLPIRE